MMHFPARLIYKSSLFLSLSLLCSIFLSSTIAATPEFELLHSLGKQEGSPSGKLVQDTNGNLYGTTIYGGNYGRGAIYTIDKQGNYSILHSFYDINVESPQSGVILGNDGNLYGVTYKESVSGTIFKLDINGSTPVYTVLYHTVGLDQPTQVIQGSDGKLYGTTSRGNVFRLDTSGAMPVFTVLPKNTRERLWGSVIQGSDGKLYGTTLVTQSGMSIGGTVFQIDITNPIPTYAGLFTFSGNFFYFGDLNLGSDGKLYGTTMPDEGPATVFQIDTTGSAPLLNNLYSFNANDYRTQHPTSGLIRGSDGKFYGTMERNEGYSEVFQLDLSGVTPIYMVLYAYDGVNSVPYNLTQGGDGNLYGMVAPSSNSSTGGVVRINISGAEPLYTVLHKFGASESRTPSSGFIQAKDGKFYGMTAEGGKGGHGSVFQFDISETAPTYRTLYDFGLTNGSGLSVYPYAFYNLLQGNDGKFYGTTNSGGSNSHGTIFQLDISGTTPIYRDLYSFNMRSNPSGLIQSSDGKFYGITYYGGINDYGTVFQFDASGASPVFNVLHDFELNAGRYPNTALIQGSDGKYYGSSDFGSVFKLDFSGVAPIVNSFDQYVISGFRNQVVQGRDGKFYGTSDYGGLANKGTVFQLDISGSSAIYTILHAFDGASYAHPSRLIEGSDGKLYGTTGYGGSTDKGIVYQLDTSGATPIYTVLHEFDGNNGQFPEAGLIQASNGNLYGTTSLGGLYNGGSIFRIKLNSTPINTPPVAANDSYALVIPKNNKPITVVAPGVLKNDKDGEDDELNVVGTTTTKPRIIELPKGAGKVALYADGHFSFILPKKCFYGSSTFTYQVTDGKATSNPATVTLTFRRVNKQDNR